MHRPYLNGIRQREKAKAENNFELFAPHLEEIVYYTRKFIQYKGYEGHPYNRALDDFEPGMTVKTRRIIY